MLTCEQGIDDRLDAGINEPLEDLVGDAKQRDWTVASGIVQRFVGLRNSYHQRASTNVWSHRQEDRNLRSQGLILGPAWNIGSGHIWSGPGTLLGSSFWRASASSAGENSLVKGEPLGVGIFQSSEVSSLTSLVVSRSLVSYFPFRNSCEAMAFAEIGHWRGGVWSGQQGC